MSLNRNQFSHEYPELDVQFPKGRFVVDGIVYIPPWIAENVFFLDDVPVHHQPMFDIKNDVWCEQDGDLCTCDTQL